MITIKKYTTGKYKGWNIRQTKDGKFHTYKGTVVQYGGFNFFKDAKDILKYHFS